MNVANGFLRADGRSRNALREVSISSGVNPYAEGSCLIKYGRTEVLCTASLQVGVPRWLKGSGSGWVTAEYGMLPRSTGERKDREATKGKQEGRTVEIQRLIGRSLRTCFDLRRFDGLTMWLDCDVLVADGGTRTAAISGAWVAAALAVEEGMRTKRVKQNPLSGPLAAVSCGLTTSGVILDMDYQEDSTTLADGNFVLNSHDEWVEVQISAEKRALTASELLEMQVMAQDGIRQIMTLQRQLVAQNSAGETVK